MKRFGTFVIFLRKYFWIFLIVLAFVLGLLASSGPDKTLIHKFETEREVLRQQIEQRNIRIDSLDSVGLAIRKRMSVDSTKFAHALKAKEMAILKIKKQKDAVDYRNYSVADLDSIRAIILAR